MGFTIHIKYFRFTMIGNSPWAMFSTGILCAAVFTSSFGQGYNVTFASQWHDSTLVTYDGLKYNDLWGYTAPDGREYAILGSVQYTHFVDISDPEQPVEIARHAGGSNCIWRDFKTYRNYAYGVSDDCGGGLEIFDLSFLPDSIVLVYDDATIFSDVHSVFIDSIAGKMYVSQGDPDLRVFDLSLTPADPVLLNSIELGGGYVHDLHVRNDTAYCSHGSNGLWVYDLSDLNNIKVLGALTSYTGRGFNHSSWISQKGDIMVMADETHGSPLKIVDIDTLDTMKELSTFQSALLAPTYNNSIPHNPFIIEDDFVVISYYHDGIQIYNISDPERPFLAGYYDTDTIHTSYAGYEGCWGVYPFYPSGIIAGIDINNGLFVIAPQFPLRACQKDVLFSGIYNNIWDVASGDSIRIDAQFEAGSSIFIQAIDGVELLPDFRIDRSGVLSLRFSEQCPD